MYLVCKIRMKRSINTEACAQFSVKSTLFILHKQRGTPLGHCSAFFLWPPIRRSGLSRRPKL